jgi:hypothetical protein
VLRALGRHLAEDGRAVVGFGAGRDYDYGDFDADVASAGLEVQLRASTWDLRPFREGSDFLVAVLADAGSSGG